MCILEFLVINMIEDISLSIELSDWTIASPSGPYGVHILVAVEPAGRRRFSARIPLLGATTALQCSTHVI